MGLNQHQGKLASPEGLLAHNMEDIKELCSALAINHASGAVTNDQDDSRLVAALYRSFRRLRAAAIGGVMPLFRGAYIHARRILCQQFITCAWQIAVGRQSFRAHMLC